MEFFELTRSLFKEVEGEKKGEARGDLVAIMLPFFLVIDLILVPVIIYRRLVRKNDASDRDNKV